ncbi:MAG: DUF4935 domain-containing protein, partial [Symploca sp. SIO3E6]|nr:DUF4935 domain-containing protein [Caldora sp. SIO3E6]
MRNLFSWRLPPSNAYFTELWENAIFVFDTNSLLDLYRVSRSTSEDFLRVLEHLQDRIWLPYQVASEFINHREEIIELEAKSFEKVLSGLEEWNNERKNFKHLKKIFNEAGRIVASEIEFLYDEQNAYFSAIDNVEKCFREKVEELYKNHSPLDPKQDYILEKLLSLFEGKVGRPYNRERLFELHKEGAERYSKQIPPGFKDEKEKNDERKYGDFILWKQILDFAKAGSCSIIFVTGEKKEDWWIKKSGEIVSPRWELRREFQEWVKQPFWMYRTQHFLEMAKEQLKIEIKPRSIEETNSIASTEFIERTITSFGDAWKVEWTEEFEQWWITLVQATQDSVNSMVNLLQEKGTNLFFPYSSGIKGSRYSHMRELRVQ